MVNAPVKIQDLIEAVEFEIEDYACWLDRSTGKVIFLADALVAEAEAGATLAELTAEAENGAEEAALACALVNEPARFVPPPDKFDFHEYRHMERFIGTVESSAAAEELQFAIRGSGAFRRFKTALERHDLRDAWFAHRDRALERFIRDWAAANQVELADEAR